MVDMFPGTFGLEVDGIKIRYALMYSAGFILTNIEGR